MKIMTTNEASKLWGITPRRIAMLASQGRIPGAKYTENRWLIPADAEKPSDSRKRSRKTLGQNHYVFPNIIYALCNDFSVDDLDDEEKSLLDAMMLYESGDFDKGIEICVELLNNTKSLYVQIGALYILSFLYIIVRRFDEATTAILRCFDACSKAEEHKSEVLLMMHEYEAAFKGRGWLETSFSIMPSARYSSFETAFFGYLCAYQDVARANKRKTDINTNLHELSLIYMEKEGYEFLAMFTHFFVSLMYAGNGNEANEYYHLKRALEIAVKNNTFTSLAGLTSFFPDLSYTILKEFPDEVQTKYIALMELNSATYTEFFSYSGGKTMLNKLSCDDYVLISYCMRNYSVMKIAQKEDISLSKAKKQLVALYKKLGVKGKSELVSAYSYAMNNPCQSQFPMTLETQKT